ncbi:hypothetical protein [Sphingobacterium prati]|uniref:hypothetical protein n=1 Tax=Sphingobacterium prati TaxID=2737006 RepID=UPI00155483CF|nr:hypothetical protein [Sphingobacterium prati]NPE44997.1 hypothetical protein [Sphingobacterium prati]
MSNISINKIQMTVNGEGLRVKGEAFCSHDDITLSVFILAIVRALEFWLPIPIGLLLPI